MTKILVYTAIFGNKDEEPKIIGKDEVDLKGFRFVCVSDNPNISSPDYEVMVVKPEYSDVTKNARKVKVNGIDNMEEYDFAIWHDSSVVLDCKKLNDLIETVNGLTISTFQHADNCIYSEGRSCIRMKKDNPVRIALQLAYYAVLHKYPVRNGLFETTILCYDVKKFTNSPLKKLWWRQILRFSRRDQISLPFSIYKTNFDHEISIIPGVGFDNSFSKYRGHRYYNYKSNRVLEYSPLWIEKVSMWIIFRLEKHLTKFKRK